MEWNVDGYYCIEKVIRESESASVPSPYPDSAGTL